MAITVLDNNMSDKNKTKLDHTIKKLEKITGNPIKLKYFTDIKSLMASNENNDDNWIERTAQMIMKNHPSISYLSAVSEAKRWA